MQAKRGNIEKKPGSALEMQEIPTKSIIEALMSLFLHDVMYMHRPGKVHTIPLLIRFVVPLCEPINARLVSRGLTPCSPGSYVSCVFVVGGRG